MKKTMIRRIGDAALALLGVVLASLASILFFIPNKIAPGGFTGIGTLLHYLFGLPIGAAVIVMNIPLFLIGMKRLGWRFGMQSLGAMVAMSIIIDYVPVPVLTNDILLASLYGGLLMGIGIGLLLRMGITTGGTDLLATLLHHRFERLSVGAILFIIDAMVVVAAGILFDVQIAMYTIVSIFLSSRVIDILQEGFDSGKALLIISNNPQRISERILGELARGVTSLHGQGGYSKQEKDVLLCVVPRSQVVRVKNIVKDEDELAFVIVANVHEVLGEGFSRGSVK